MKTAGTMGGPLLLVVALLGGRLGHAGEAPPPPAAAAPSLVELLARALQSGKTEALSAALAEVNRRSQITIAGAAVATVKALQEYDRQLAQLSEQLGQLAGNDRGYVAKLDRVVSAPIRGLGAAWRGVRDALAVAEHRSGALATKLWEKASRTLKDIAARRAATQRALADLDPKAADYHAKLAELNADMNAYSANRQAITNLLRDVLSMREEISNVTHSVSERDRQIGAALSRW